MPDAIAEISQYIGIPTGVSGIGLSMWLWLSGRIMLTKDHEKQMETMQKAIDAVTIDRDNWHQACVEQGEARRAAELSAAALLDKSSSVHSLLEVLKMQIEHKPKVA